MKRKPRLNIVFITGMVIGIAAVVVQVYFQVRPPVAYGICLIGHPRDLTSWFINSMAGTRWFVPKVFLVYPALTGLGVLVGSLMSAAKKHEIKWRPGPVRDKSLAFILGFLVVNFALLWGSCPIRTTIYATYGNFTAVVVLFSIVAGVLLAIAYLRIRVRMGR